MHRTRPAERQHDQLPRVDTPELARPAQQPGHLRVDDPADARGGLLDVKSHLRTESRERPFGSFNIEPHLTMQERVRVDEPEDDVRVGDRRFLAAPAVASRAGFGARAARTHVETVGLVGPRDASAPSPDRLDVEDRQR